MNRREVIQIEKRIERYQERYRRNREIERELANLENSNILDVSEIDFIPEPEPFQISKKIIPPGRKIKY